ncbi:hypothetical protein POM88_037216 [Heracleum sosnowskyi]|uniref:Uncharacterized protein n=1 Tax=Heracleum sosnowskyi TaxID=360622 RepID=A0AAD8HPS7_9APIA|nr:hypothetical protein POM88_037216 [Heracleum sosnowskyi]
MEVNDRFVIRGSTKEKLETFLKNIRESWGVQLHKDYDVRVLPDVGDDEIYSIQLATEEGEEKCDFIFQRNNVYLIAWGEPDKMMIFDDAASNFKKIVEEELDSDPKSKSQGKAPPPTQIVRNGSRERPPIQTSQSGRRYRLSEALNSKIKFDYTKLVEKGGLRRDQVIIGKHALENAVYAFISPFIAEGKAHRNNYVMRISKSSLVLLHTLPESLRNDEIYSQNLKSFFQSLICSIGNLDWIFWIYSRVCDGIQSLVRDGNFLELCGFNILVVLNCRDCWVVLLLENWMTLLPLLRGTIQKFLM